MRLPENLVEKRKGMVADIREKGQIPSLHYIGEFVRKCVRAEFDPDFGDMQNEMKNQKSESSGGSREGRGLNSTQKTRPPKSYICKASHGVPNAPPWRIQRSTSGSNS